jgi:hypothetical protein
LTGSTWTTVALSVPVVAFFLRQNWWRQKIALGLEIDVGDPT